MIKFPDKPEGCFWRVRKYGVRWPYEVKDNNMVVVELHRRVMEDVDERRTFGPFEWYKTIQKDGSEVVWSDCVRLDNEWFKYSIDALESAIEVAVEKKYSDYIYRLSLEKKVFGDYS